MLFVQKELVKMSRVAKMRELGGWAPGAWSLDGSEKGGIGKKLEGIEAKRGK